MWSRRNREASIGVKVSDTAAETTMVIASVTANSRNSRPMMPLISSSGISTAISDSEIDTTVKPISPAPFSAAWNGFMPCFDVAGDVFEHHDRVVDDEADGDRQRHQRKIVEAVIGRPHHGAGAEQAPAAR